MSQTYQTISHIALIILCRMIEATTTFTSTSTTRSYTPQQEQEQQQQEQHEHLTSLLGFRSEPGHLKCRSSLRGREWHIESALQVPPSPAPLMWHAPFPIYTHKHTHQFAAHMHPNDAHLVRYVWPGQRWPSHPLEPQLSCCPFPSSLSRSPPVPSCRLFASSAAATVKIN